MPVSSAPPTSRRPRRRLLAPLAAAACAALVLGLTGVVAPAAAADAPYDVLVFSKTAGFRHSSISSGVTAIQELGAANDFTVTATEDAGAFTTANLAQYEAVVFLLTTGDVLNASQQSAFEGYIRAGGGYAGVHAASDTEYDWDWYGDLVGAYFAGHPAVQQATIHVEDHDHPSTAHLGNTWVRTDEWYDYSPNPRSSVNVLARLDESTYSGGNMGADHPIAWYQEYDGGRSWYTGGGHTEATYSEPDFRAHLLGGIRYAAGVAGAPEPGTEQVREGEGYSSTSGVSPFPKSFASGGSVAGSISNGDWIAFTSVDLSSATSITSRVLPGSVGGTIQYRAGSATGPLLGSSTITQTGNWNTLVDVTATVSSTTATSLYLVFTGGAGSFFDVDTVTIASGAPATPVDLTPGSTATASSVENSSHPASNAIDGNTGTRWSSQFSDPQSITVDLGEAHTVTGVKLNWEYAASKAYSVQTSADGSNWRTASYSTTTGDGGVDDVTFATAAADTRYVRVTGTTRTTPWGHSLWELQVYGT